MGRLPDFVIIGQQRCGTTSLYATLGKHPEIGLSDAGELDEIHYFVNHKRYKRGLEWYKNRFNSLARIVGEKSPMTLQHHLAPRRMKKANPNAKLIVMLRNPIDRAYSNYNKAIAKGFVDCPFEDAIKLELEMLPLEAQELGAKLWLAKFWGSNHHLLGFLERGHYADHLLRWFQFFKRNQIMVIKSEDFFSNPQQVLVFVQAFLEVEQVDLETSHLQNLKYSDMSDSTRRLLADYFKERNMALARLIGIDLEDWQ